MNYLKAFEKPGTNLLFLRTSKKTETSERPLGVLSRSADVHWVTNQWASTQLAPAWQWVSACVATTVNDRWGPRACVGKEKKLGPFAPRGFRTRDETRGSDGQYHWASCTVVIQNRSATFCVRSEACTRF